MKNDKKNDWERNVRREISGVMGRRGRGSSEREATESSVENRRKGRDMGSVYPASPVLQGTLLSSSPHP